MHAIAALAFLSAPVLPLTAAEEVSLLPNGGFETRLDGWRRVHGRCAAVTDSPHSGEACLRIERAGAVTTDLIDVTDTMLEISGWIRTEGVERGKRPWNLAGYQITRYGADRKPYGRNAGRGEFARVQGTTDWTEYRTSVIGKKGLRYVRIQCHLWGCAAGVGYFDDIKLVRKPIPASYFAVKPREEVENDAPVVWPMPPVKAGPDVVDNGVVRLSFAGDQAPAIEFSSGGEGSFEPVLKGFRMDFTTNGQRYERGKGLVASGGYSVRRSYMTRRAETWRSRPETQDPQERKVEFFVEMFWQSPRVYLYPRIILGKSTVVERVQAELLLPEGYPTAYWFDGPSMRRAPLSARPAVTLGSDTCKPFVAVDAGGGNGNRGLAVFIPLPPEVRTWYVEDYVPAPQPVRVEFSPDGIRFTVERFLAPAKGHHASFDLYYTLMPFAGVDVQTALGQWPTKNALHEAKLPFGPNLPNGFWTKRMPRDGACRSYRCSRYFPVECFSYCGIDKQSPTYDYWHLGGHAWGMLTGIFKGVNFSGFRSTGLQRDLAIRLGQFYLERADELGEPPALTTVGGWARQMSDPTNIRRFHFGQFGEFTLPMFRHWLLKYGVGTPEDKDFIWSQLNRLKSLYDPAHPRTWTWRTPGGGYWFCYSNVFRKDPKPDFVINTHTTAVGNAGELMLIARGLGKEADYAWWRQTFRKGVDGLMWDLGLDDAWYVDGHDPNEVRYGRGCGGPSGYHGYMATAWLPKVIEAAIEDGRYRLDELLAIERRLIKADYLDRVPRLKRLAEQFLKTIEQSLKR